MSEMLIVNLPPATIGICREFSDNFGRPADGKSIVITPLRITMISQESNKVSFGCNMWKSCQNTQCSYCQAGMDKRENT